MANVYLSNSATIFAAGRIPSLNSKIDIESWQAEENGWPRGANGQRGLASTPTAQELEYLQDRYVDYRIEKANQAVERQLDEFGKASREKSGAWEGIREEVVNQVQDAAKILATGVAILAAPFSKKAAEYRDEAGWAMYHTLATFFKKETYNIIAEETKKATRHASRLGDQKGAKIRTIAILSVISPFGWLGRVKKTANLAEAVGDLGENSAKAVRREASLALQAGEGNADATHQLQRRLNPIIDKLEQGERDIHVLRDDLQEISGDLTPDVFAPHVQFADSGYTRATIYRDPDGKFEVLALGWKPGQGTVPHDHGGSSGLDLVISGEGKEIHYHIDPNGILNPLKEVPLLAGVVYAIEDQLIHKVLNASQMNMVSLHVYFPAMDGSKIRKFPNEG